MKSQKEILEYYGRCCVSEFTFGQVDYPSGEEGKRLQRIDANKLIDIIGQKKAIEHIMEVI